MVPNSSDKRYYPSPGQYDTAQSGTLKKSVSSPDLRKSSCMGSSPRFAGLTTVLKDGIVVSGTCLDPHLHEPLFTPLALTTHRELTRCRASYHPRARLVRS